MANVKAKCKKTAKSDDVSEVQNQNTTRAHQTWAENQLALGNMTNNMDFKKYQCIFANGSVWSTRATHGESDIDKQSTQQLTMLESLHH